jgi:hypothetical protein
LLIKRVKKIYPRKLSYTFVACVLISQMKKRRNAYSPLVGKAEVKRPLGRRRWVDNIKMNAGEEEWGDMD